ncbi:MAG TPA: nucleotidyltransferase family protein [Vicinamibacterales bacterium]
MTREAAVLGVAAAIDGRSVDSASDPDLIVERAIAHRVSGLVLRSEWARGLSSAQSASLAEAVRLGALHAELLDGEVRAVIARLAERGVTPFLMKGAHLARTVYPSPALRPRHDTDLLIRPEDRSVTVDTLSRFGYTRSPTTSGSIILGQLALERRLRADATHFVDVHWRIAAPLLFGQVFDANALMASAVPIPALGPHARGPALERALALACVHLVAHHWHQILLVWLYDIRLLADAIDDQDRERLVEDAVAGRYTVMLRAALMTARRYFESEGLDRAIACVTPRVDDSEPLAALVRDGRRPVDDLWLDLRHAGWADRARLLREHVLPPVQYMRARFGGPVPLAYARRFFRGVRKWI